MLRREFIDLSLKDIRMATVSSGNISLLKSTARAVYSTFYFSLLFSNAGSLYVFLTFVDFTNLHLVQDLR